MPSLTLLPYASLTLLILVATSVLLYAPIYFVARFHGWKIAFLSAVVLSCLLATSWIMTDLLTREWLEYDQRWNSEWMR